MTASPGHYEQLLADLREPTRSLRHQMPEAWGAFTRLHEEAMDSGALPAHIKELMALVASVVKRCDGCIGYHAKAAARKGATPDEVGEALAVALLMDGGVASVYAPRAWDAYQEVARAHP
jgi:AhpD family alkylhydroperoxidase